MNPADCRFLAEPIDMMVFNGLSENKIDKISFVEIKTGASPLNTHQRRVRDAITDHNVKWRTF
jgi:predicted Holliday junction resolvase-like endonuclease